MRKLFGEILLRCISHHELRESLDPYHSLDISYPGKTLQFPVKMNTRGSKVLFIFTQGMIYRARVSIKKAKFLQNTLLTSKHATRFET